MDIGPVKRFKINKLYGYKDIEIEFVGQVLILVAGNGSGKTTILNALHAFLRGRFNRLSSLDFHSIECEFTRTGEVIVLTKEQTSSKDADLSEKLRSFVGRTGVTEDDLYEFLANTYQPSRGSLDLRGHPVVEMLYRDTPYDYDDLDERFNDLHASVSSPANAELKAATESIQFAVQGVEVVYLPTYRRIENPLLSPRGKQRHLNPTLHRTRRRNVVALDISHMNYGLEDVESRLAELSDEVERISNLEYRSASATIIDEALANSISPGTIGLDELPSLEPLARFLLRVSKAERSFQRELTSDMEFHAERNAKRRVEAITRLYESGRIKDADQGVLRYFLSRLGTVIERTRETEAMLQRFVEACNSYLTDSSDEKRFVYEPNSMRVTVVNSFTGDVVPLGQLSSGEKQIVSILAKLYLHSGKNLILIDEPELSLSIDWQRRIIPDMLSSGSVAQLLAITHSPFIFENELDPFAGPIRVVRHRVSKQ